ncbi:MAG TPA: Wzz/FepE/Etk N-terminal domain-containing protein [Steroidobacteraceae bacterium]|nr:Wzz/FepE/Etk N-terminal domain-containing protein [Steroidobacteraceae bacterium]
MSRATVAPIEADIQSRDRAPARASVARDDGVSLREFLLFIWRSRWVALAAGALCAIVALVAALVATPEYTASVVLLPVNTHGGSMDLGASASELGGLASLAGINLSGANQVKTEALATLESEILTEQYIRQNNLLPVLFSSDWNAATRQWDTTDPQKVPTLWKANKRFKDVRSIVDDTKTGLVTLTIRWKSPYIAAQWANGLVQLTNDYLKQRAIGEAERSIAYLSGEVGKTNIVEVKSAIYTLMETQIKNEMIARGRDEYALRVIDPAVPPEKKSFPRPVLWTAGAFLGGIFLGFLVCVVRETMADELTSGLERNRIQNGPTGPAAPVFESEMDQP